MLSLCFAGNIVEDDCVMRQQSGSLIVVIACFVDGVAHVDESQQVYDKGAAP